MKTFDTGFPPYWRTQIKEKTWPLCTGPAALDVLERSREYGNGSTETRMQLEEVSSTVATVADAVMQSKVAAPTVGVRRVKLASPEVPVASVADGMIGSYREVTTV